jgi:hypothetical protein
MRDRIVLPTERHILFDQASESRRDLGCVSLGLWGDCHPVQCRREFGFLDRERVILFAEGIARRCRAQFRDGSDIARMDELGRDLFLALNANQTYAHPHLVLIPYVQISLDGPGEDTEVSHPADKWISSSLPDICGEWLSVRGFQFLFTVPALRHA